MTLYQTLRAFQKDETGATSIEYGVISSLIAAEAIPVFSKLGGDISATLAKIAGAMQDAKPVPDAISTPAAAPPAAPV